MPTLPVLLSLHQFSGSTVLRYTITNTDCVSFIWRSAKRNASSAMVVMVPNTSYDIRRVSTYLYLNDKLWGINLILTLCTGFKTIFLKFQHLSATSVSNSCTHSLYSYVPSASISEYNYPLFLGMAAFFTSCAKLLLRKDKLKVVGCFFLGLN